MRLYNTLSGEEQEFSPAGDTVKMYVCGVTPYAPCHLGHAMSYVFFDVLRRYLEYIGYEIEHVQNFTDIDDKIIQRAQESSVDTDDLAQTHIEEFMDSMDSLNIQRAHHYPRATQEIPQILKVIEELVDKGYAYASDGDVYFRVAKYGTYGDLSHRSLDGMIAGARVEVGAAKEHPMDFALWKAAKPGEPSWDSQWGPGRPGWHIECTAMSMSYLGNSLDIHGGGQDLVFPHHENEKAQSEAYTGEAPFVRYWVHNGLLNMGDDKMSKSLGNNVSLNEALKRHGADALRIFFLSSHYRGPLTYSEEGVSATERAAERLSNAFRLDTGEGAEELDPEPYRERFSRAMDSDLNTPQALASMFDLAREINRSRETGAGVQRAQGVLKDLGGVLGLTFDAKQDNASQSSGAFIQLLVDTRTELRQSKQYSLADQIRSRLLELGVELEDTAQGTDWRFR